jgi:hypothetical protein
MDIKPNLAAAVNPITVTTVNAGVFDIAIASLLALVFMQTR